MSSDEIRYAAAHPPSNGIKPGGCLAAIPTIAATRNINRCALCEARS
jgi:hypothetical protein